MLGWFDRCMEPAPQSRVAAGRMRAAAAKGVLGAGALGALAVFALPARGSHAAAPGQSGGAGQLQAPAGLLASLQEDSDDLQGGQIAPAEGTPQVESGTS